MIIFYNLVKLINLYNIYFNNKSTVQPIVKYLC